MKNTASALLYLEGCLDAAKMCGRAVKFPKRQDPGKWYGELVWCCDRLGAALELPRDGWPECTAVERAASDLDFIARRADDCVESCNVGTGCVHPFAQMRRAVECLDAALAGIAKRRSGG